MSVVVDQLGSRNARLIPPQWVLDRFGSFPSFATGIHERRELSTDGPRISFEVVGREPLTLVEGCLGDAVELTVDEFRSAVFDLYRGILRQLVTKGSPHPIRIWSFVPAIDQSMGEGLTRYMVFNSGRHDAFSSWYPDPAQFERSLPTSTGVGHDGRDLIVFCLASRYAGEPRENVRQRPSYRYSQAYGPLPPCFARATLARLEDAPALLIGGTASVRGEASVHFDDVESQLEETFANLDSLVHAQPDTGISDMCMQDVRVYYVNREHADLLRSSVSSRFPELRRLEMMQAKLCRRELLVEIEGIAVARIDAGDLAVP